jgi:hypothetical protein
LIERDRVEHGTYLSTKPILKRMIYCPIGGHINH